jgi:hypothetical protein
MHFVKKDTYEVAVIVAVMWCTFCNIQAVFQANNYSGEGTVPGTVNLDPISGYGRWCASGTFLGRSYLDQEYFFFIRIQLLRHKPV